MGDEELHAIQERKRAGLRVPAEAPPAEPARLPCRLCGQKVIEMPGTARHNPVRVLAWNAMAGQPPIFMCGTCQTAEGIRQEQEALRRAMAARQMQVDAVRADPEGALARCGVPTRWRRASLDQCRDLPPELARSAQEWAETPKGMVLLYGPPGAGKTYLAVAMLRHALVAGIFTPPDCLYITERAFLGNLRARFDAGEHSGGTRAPACYHARVLVLDDLAASRLTDWGRGEIAGLIEYRHGEDLPTIITSNMDPDGLVAAVDGRVVSRIAESRELWCFPRRDLRIEGSLRPAGA